MTHHPPPPPPRPGLGLTVSYALVGLLVLGTAISVPFALQSVANDLRRSGNDRVFYATGAGSTVNPAFRVHLDITAIDEGGGGVAVRVTAARGCGRDCAESARLTLLSSISEIDGAPFADAEFLPVIERLEFPIGTSTLSRELRLPIYGRPIHYPFDEWLIDLKMEPSAIAADGGERRLSIDDSTGQIVLTVQNRVPRLGLDQRRIGAERGGGPGAPSSQLAVSLHFARPLYLKVITVLLVLLVGAAAAYAALLRPLGELIVNVGALVLGIWGVRAVLLGTDLEIVTAVDLALMSVILFLLATLTVRTFWILEPSSRVRLMRDAVERGRRRGARAAPPPPDDAGPGPV